jgi:photosystem II stability/assembly factor-like uncharacterized protein
VNLANGSPAQLQAPAATLPGLMLTDADFVSTQDGWISGGVGGLVNGPSLSAGIIARTTDSGRGWRVAHLPGLVPTQLLFLSSKVGFAIAGHPGQTAGRALPGPFGLPQANLILRSGDGGRTWATVFDAGGNVTDLAAGQGSIWATTAGTCSSGTCSGKIYAASQAPGSSWSTLWTAPGAVLSVALKGQRAWAVVATGNGKGSAAEVYASSDGGAHFAELATLPTTYELSYFSDPSQLQAQITFTDSQDGWVTLWSMQSCAMHGCDVSDVYRTTDGGHTWTKETKTSIGCEFEPVLAASGQDVAVAQGVNLAACQGPESTIFLSRDGGGTFKVAQRWQTLGVTSMGFIPGGGLWTLGSGNNALAVQGADGRWQQIFPALAPVGPIDFVNASEGFGAGDALDPGAVLRTTDGGRLWKEISTIPNLGVDALAFPTAKVGYVYAASVDSEGQVAEILRTTDGGVTWSQTHAPASSSGGAPTTLKFFSATSGLFINLYDCTDSCTPEVVTTKDAGKTWQVSKFGASAYSPQSATALAPNRYVVGWSADGRALTWLGQTTNGGVTWTTLSNLRLRSGSLLMDFPTPDVGYVMAFVYHAPNQAGTYELLTTSNGGKTWTQHVFTSPVGWGSSLALDFLDARRGWLLNGSVLWSTHNAGRTWIAVHTPVPTEP